MSHFLESLEEETTQNIQNFEGHIVKRIVSAKKKPNHFYYLVNFEDMEGIFWFNSEEADYIIPIKMIEEFKETHPKIFNKKHKINNINIVNNNNNNNNNNNDNSNNNNNNKEESTQIEEMIFQKDLSNWKNTLQHSKRKASKCNPQILLKTNPQFEKDILDIFKIEDISNVDIQVMVGGYTCHSFSLAYKEKLAFLKIQNNDSGYAMLDREFKGLEFFKKILKFLNYKKIKMPKIYSCQKLKNKGAYLLMEFIERDPILNPDTSDGWILMGEILAEFHQICIEKNVSDKFGGEIDGFLSILPMPNNFKNNWIEFFIENRFKFELDIFKEISTKNNEIVYYGESLLKKIPGFFKNLTIKPVLCHGDLNNNWFFSKKNKKLIFFDVCPFFGHNEFDFTQLPLVDRVKDGISSYFRNFRKDEGYEKRHTLYQIFRCLHDMNTFGYLQHKKHILKYFDSLGFLREEFEEEKMKRVKQVQKKQTQKKKNPKDANLILSDSRLFQIVPKNLELLQKRIKNFENIKLGVLFASGSYCPPHFNHITVIKSTLEFLEKEKNFFFLNCFISPLNDHYIKSKLNGFCINVQDRCQLLENFLKDYNRITVNKTQKIGQIFPEITIEHIKTLLPKDLISKKKIYRVELCGADSVEKAVGWLGKFIERGDVELAVVRRNGYDKTLDKFLKQSPLSDKIHVNRNWEGPDLSSTEIRKLFREKNFSKLEEMMPKENIEFLKNIFK